MSMYLGRKSRKSKIFDIFNVTFLLIFSAIMLYPLLYVLSVSISSSEAVTYGQVFLWPVGFDLTAYKITIMNPDIWNAYKNTIVYVVLGTIATLLFTTMAAYALSRKNLYGRTVIMLFFTITMFFSGGMIPSYILISRLNLIDTIWVMTIPAAVGAWNIIIFRTNFQGLPTELIEAAQIDGARHFLIYRSVVLPLSKPIIATIGLFTVVAKWNDFFTALLYINDIKMIPLQNYLRSLIVNAQFESQNIEESLSIITVSGTGKNISGLMESIKMAAIIVSLGPILMAYPFVQQYFVKGVLVGSVKG